MTHCSLDGNAVDVDIDDLVNGDGLFLRAIITQWDIRRGVSSRLSLREVEATDAPSCEAITRKGF